MFPKLHTPLFNETTGADMGGSDAAGDAEMMNLMVNAGNQAQNPSPAPEPAPKPEAKTETIKVEEKPKSLTDKLGKIEDPKEEETTESTDDLPDPAKGEGAANEEKRKTAWSAIKAEAKEAKRLAAELAEWKQKYEEKAASALPKEVESELAELRQAHAVVRLQKTPEYQQAVTVPMGRIEGEVKEISDEFGLDQESLWKAFSQTSEWRRNDAIDKLLAGVEKEVPGGVANALHNAANRMHSVWQKQAELHQEAEQLQASYEHKSTETQQQQTQAQEQAWNKAAEESRAMIEGRLGSLLKNMPDAERTAFTESLKSSKISDDPAERALQAQAPHVAAVMIQQYNNAKKEIAALKKERDALLNARPGTQQKTGESAPKASSPDEDDEEMFNSMLAARQ